MLRAIFIVLVIGLLVILAGTLVYFKSAVSQGLGDASAEACARNPEPGAFNAAPYYSGPLFETHLHIPSTLPPPKIIRDKLGVSQEYATLGGELTIEKIVCLMDREHIIRSMAFFPYMDFPFLHKPFTSIAARTVKTHGERIIPFVAPVPFVTTVPHPDTLKRVFDKSPDVFGGYGEITFYWDEYEGLSPDDENFLKSYEIAGERGLAVMLHPDNGQEAALRNAFARFPNVSFILHSEEIKRSLESILAEYPNVYFTLDTTMLPPFFRAESKEEFIAMMQKDFSVLLASAVSEWKPLVEAHPQQFLWGTDRFTPWSYDEEVGRVVEEFFRAFIARLDPAVQELYAYQNAERLFPSQ